VDRRKSQQNRKNIRVIPYGKQDISQTDIESVIKVLQSDFLTQGSQVPLFEKTVSNYCGAAFGVAVNSATSALHIACLALGLGKGDWLWTSPNSFVASANCGLYCGAKIDFVDIDPQTYNLSAEELERKLIQAKQDDNLPKIVIPVHFSGQSCDMKKIHSLSQEYGFKIIEDASHAIGGKYLDQPIGGCQYSDITVFSFHPVKIITTAEGGLATTNDKELSERMQLFRSHGVTRNPELMSKLSEGGWYYQQVDLGFNYRMTELQAALGVSQMQRLDEFVTQRHILQERYDSLLNGLPIIKPHQSQDSYSALHLYPIQIDVDSVGKGREKIFDELRQNGIGVNVHYIPIHTQPYYLQFGFKVGDFPNSESYYNRAISIPLFHAMTAEQQDEVLNVLMRVLQ
jgi:UDP-4-amino-4,6-dideoxy-N-acetyl-beta-L-altrosamine transaminase